MGGAFRVKQFPPRVYAKTMSHRCDDACSICNDDLATRIAHALPCGHAFHVQCIIDWFRRGRSDCPLCRDDPNIASTAAPSYAAERITRKADLAVFCSDALALGTTEAIITDRIERHIPLFDLLQLVSPMFAKGNRLLEQAMREGDTYGLVYNDSAHAAVCAVCAQGVRNKDVLCGIAGSIDGMLAAHAVVVQYTAEQLRGRDLNARTREAVMNDAEHVCREL